VTDNSPAPEDQEQRPKIDASIAHTARVWNYWLGGKDNFAVDRAVGDEIRSFNPDIVDIALADRAFLGRAVRYLVDEAGIRQFLDIGTGLPTADNTHEVAQRLAPESRIVYVDNDPMVLVHARALLTSSPEGVTDYIEADARDTDEILQAAARTLNFTQPVALMLVGVLLFVLDDEEAHAIVKRLLDAVPSGSYLTIVHPSDAINTEAMQRNVQFWNENATPPMTMRTPEEIASFFDGLELVEPGVVSLTRWRPDPSRGGRVPAEVAGFCGIGRKP